MCLLFVEILYIKEEDTVLLLIHLQHHKAAKQRKETSKYKDVSH